MDFEESLFDDFDKKTKTQRTQCSYEARNQETGWFMTSNNDAVCDKVQLTDILKSKADYFYGQCKYEKALDCYKKLLPLISTTNTTLCREVNEAIILCLRKTDRSNEAIKIVEKLLEADKSDASLWLLLFHIHKDRNDWLGAIFSLQCCLEHHEEVAAYWMDLAESYFQISACLELKDSRAGPVYMNVHNSPEHVVQNCCDGLCFRADERQLCCYGRSCLCDAHDSSILTNSNIVEKMCEMTMENNKEGDTKWKRYILLQTDYKEDASLTQKCRDCTGVNHYVWSHYYCFCAMCSVLIARFLLHKYSFHLSPLVQRKSHGKFLKINAMLKSIVCASDGIKTSTEKLLNEKFAMLSGSGNKSEYASLRLSAILSRDVLTQRIKNFEKRWFLTGED